MHMRWHKDCTDRQDGLMVHPSDGDAWKSLNNFDPDFDSDPRNVRISLATDGLWELPYAKSLILMHNIDVMHQESNFCQALINTCMDFPDKTKDNDKAHMDLAVICDSPTQVLRENGGKPKANYCLKPKQQKEVMKWMKDIKFIDGYVACFRRSMNLKTMKMNGLKNHDFHIIMERLMPVMFRGVHFRCCVENVS